MAGGARSTDPDATAFCAYPWLVAVDEDVVPRPPTARDVAIVQAISVALAQLIEGERKQMRNAWKLGKGLVTTMSVQAAFDIAAEVIAMSQRRLFVAPTFA